MWALSNRTPHAAERTWVRDKDGNHVWVVAVKATFDLDDKGQLRLSAEQEPPLHEPVYLGEPGLSSLRYEAELVAPKLHTDVLIHACAHAPGGSPAPSVKVAARIHDVDKMLVVHGERIYKRGVLGVSPSAPKPFVRQPIIYEWAWGGTDTTDPDPRKHRGDPRNPVGRGLATSNAHLVAQPAHRIEYLQGNPAEQGPAGFGPIASHWSPRLELSGTFDDVWSKTRRPLLPRDHDERSALCAPADQRPSRRLVGGEQIVLYQLTPRGSLSFVLPRLRFGFDTHFGAIRRFHEASLGTPAATVRAVASTRETQLIHTDALNLGEGLTAAVSKVLAPLDSTRETVENIHCDINGDRYRSEEWGFVALRLGTAFRDATAYHTPVRSCGDVGAATGALNLVMSAQAWRRGYSSGPHTLVWGSSDAGLRAAVLLEEPVPERGGT